MFRKIGPGLTTRQCQTCLLRGGVVEALQNHPPISCPPPPCVQDNTNRTLSHILVTYTQHAAYNACTFTVQQFFTSIIVMEKPNCGVFFAPYRKSFSNDRVPYGDPRIDVPSRWPWSLKTWSLLVNSEFSWQFSRLYFHTPQHCCYKTGFIYL